MNDIVFDRRVLLCISGLSTAVLYMVLLAIHWESFVQQCALTGNFFQIIHLF